MKFIPKRTWQLKNLKVSFLVLTIGMVIASIYTAYCVLTRGEVLQSNPKLWLAVIGVYVFMLFCTTYYAMLSVAYRKRKRTEWWKLERSKRHQFECAFLSWNIPFCELTKPSKKRWHVPLGRPLLQQRTSLCELGWYLCAYACLGVMITVNTFQLQSYSTKV